MEKQKLILIGNGFDLNFGLDTKYSDFEKYILEKFREEKKTIEELYPDFDYNTNSLWSDFEMNLSKISKEMVLKYATNLDESKRMCSLIHNSPKIVKSMFECWVNSINCTVFSGYKELINNAFIINFNYTKTLENNFDVPDNLIYHIHGTVKENIIFGHEQGVLLNKQGSAPYDMDIDDIKLYNENVPAVIEWLNEYLKATEKPVDKLIKRSEFLLKYKYKINFKKINEVFVIGLSCSKIDIPYIRWIDRIARAKWHVGYYGTNKYQNLFNEIHTSDIEFKENKDLIDDILI